MKIINDLSTFKSNKKTFVTLGTFDGVHIGHLKVIKSLVHNASLENADAVLITFFPHPKMVLKKNSNIKLINTIDERIQLLEKTGLQTVIVVNFTKEFAEQTALEFVQSILIDKLNVSNLVIGYDHQFGKNRDGNFEQLQKYGRKFGFNVKEIPEKTIQNFTVSSTKIRNAIEQGEIEKAAAFLGYHFMLSGSIVKGENLGAKIGFPTANLEIKETYKLLPKIGAYIVKSKIENCTYYGMMNIGFRPTVQGNHQTIEIHFFDLNEDLYDKHLQIEVLSFLRNEQKFNSIDELKNQLQKDKETSLKKIEKYFIDC